MYKEDLALNNLQWLICHKTQPNQIKLNQTKPIMLLYQLFLNAVFFWGVGITTYS